MRMILRRVRGAAVNALFWAFAWFGFGLGMHLVPRLLSGSPVYLAGALLQGLSTAFFGFFLGGAFSLYLAANFRHQDVDEISPARFGLGGALVTVLLLLVVMLVVDAEQIADEVLSQPLELYGSILKASLFAAAVGGATAFGTIKAAQVGSHAERLERGSRQILPGVPVDGD